MNIMNQDGKIFRYWAVVTTGFEEVALEEMFEHLPNLRVDRREKGRSQTKIFFTFERSPMQLLKLRSVQAVYALIAEIRGITVGAPGMARLVDQVGQSDLAAAQRLARSLDPNRDVSLCHVNATVQGHHRFKVSDLLYHLQKTLSTCCNLGIGAPHQGLLLQLQVRGRSAVLGMRLRAADAITPHATAYCMGRILGLEPEDRILWLRRDCTEVAEFIQSFGVEVFAGTALREVPADVEHGCWFAWDGLKVPVLDEECSHFMASCKVGTESVLIDELARILPVGCIALVEVERKEAMAPLIAAHAALEIAAVLPIGNRGRQHYLYAIERVFAEDLLQVQIFG